MPRSMMTVATTFTFHEIKYIDEITIINPNIKNDFVRNLCLDIDWKNILNTFKIS